VGRKPYAIPGSLRSPPRRLGFASWAREVEVQERELGAFFDTIIVCAVTGSTQAGMIAGFADRETPGGRPRRIIGIDASAKVAETRDQVARIARFTAKAIGLERGLRDDEIVLDDRYHAGTYGIPDASTLDAMRLAARLEAMITDPVYEGKSMAGLIDLVSHGEIEPDSTVLYAHLGGQPAINAYASLFS
jgi:1-aminocyclopropane-1-carboxylate deaminase